MGGEAHRVRVVPGAWVRRGVLVLTLSALPVRTFAGHDLFIPLVLESASPAATQGRCAGTAAVGVPIPESAELPEVDRLVLVGADGARFRVVELWGSGFLRWILVEAEVTLARGARSATVYLTTGAPGVQPPLRDAVPSVTPAAVPLVGRALGVDAYNDGEALRERLLAGGDPPAGRPQPGPHFPLALEQLREYLRCAGQRCGEWRAAAGESLRSALQELEAGRAESAPGEAASAWFRVTGDESARTRYVAYGERILAGGNAPAFRSRAEELAQWVDLWRVSGDGRFATRAWQLSAAAEWTGVDAEAAIPALAAAAREWRGRDEARADIAFDLLERAVAAAVAAAGSGDPHDLHALTEAYRLWGGRARLARAAAAAEALPPDPDPAGQSLLHFVRNPDRYRVWRPLALGARAVAGGFELSWSAPPAALTYRVKRAPAPIAADGAPSAPLSYAFAFADNITGEPVPGPAGSLETLRVPGGGSGHFAGRFLERSPWEQRQRARATAVATAQPHPGQVPRTATFRFTPGLRAQSAGEAPPLGLVVLLLALALGAARLCRG